MNRITCPKVTLFRGSELWESVCSVLRIFSIIWKVSLMYLASYCDAKHALCTLIATLQSCMYTFAVGIYTCMQIEWSGTKQICGECNFKAPLSKQITPPRAMLPSPHLHLLKQAEQTLYTRVATNMLRCAIIILLSSTPPTLHH